MLSIDDTPKTNPTARGSAVAALPSSGRADALPTTAIRHVLRALASETGPEARLRGVKRVRPLVAEAHRLLRDRLEAGGAVEDYLRGRARLADAAVAGLLHVAAVSTGLLGNSMVAPLAVVATGGYGRRELAPGSDLDLLFLLSEADGDRPEAAIADCINAVVAGLWDLGFVLDHAARSPRQCLALAQSEPTVLATLLDRRFLWGRYGLFARLDGDLAALFAGPDAGYWRNAVRDALAHRAPQKPGDWPPDDEPDVKHGPGGLRDLQRVLVGAGSSGRPTAPPELAEAHRFLWLLRCHLHLLAGRAEDRMRAALQPPIARRLGMDDPPKAVTGPTGAGSGLLRRFRQHARTVLEALARATDGAAGPLH